MANFLPVHIKLIDIGTYLYKLIYKENGMLSFTNHFDSLLLFQGSSTMIKEILYL